MDLGHSSQYHRLSSNDNAGDLISNQDADSATDAYGLNIAEQADQGGIQPNSFELQLTDRVGRERMEPERKTVEQVINTIGFGKFQLRLIVSIGFAVMADSMEILTMTILAPALHCAMQLNTVDQALLTSVFFVGMLIGAPIFGLICDRYGRKPCLLLYPIVTGYCGLLCGLSPRSEWILILRGLVGFGVGGSVQLTTYMSEFLPTRWRATSIIVVSLFSALGSLVESIVALVVMPLLGWRYLLAFSSLPIIAFTLIAYRLPESPRFLLTSGREDDARRVLAYVAHANHAHLDIPPLIIDVGDADEAKAHEVVSNSTAAQRLSDDSDDDAGVERSLINSNERHSEGDQDQALLPSPSARQYNAIFALFAPSVRRTTLTLWPIWLNTAFAYYGVLLLTVEIFERNAACTTTSVSQVTYSDQCYVTCYTLNSADYTRLMLTSIAESVSVPFTIGIIDWIGRRFTLAAFGVLYCAAILLLNLCLGSSGVTIVLFVARTCAASAFQTVYVYASEAYPTAVRAIGLGTCSSIARVGVILTPFIAQVLSKTSLPATYILYGGSGLLNCVLGLTLPFETRGRTTHDTVR